MNCKKCGIYIENPSIPCPNCGEINIPENNNENLEQEYNSIPTQDEYVNQNLPQNRGPLGKQQKLAILIIILFMIALIILFFVVFKPTIIKLGDNNSNTNGSSETVITDNDEEDEEEDEEDEEDLEDEDLEFDEDEEITTDEEPEYDSEYDIEDLKQDDPDAYELNNMDEESIKEYYDENAEKIISVTPVSAVKNVLSEKEVIKFLKDRGFTNVEVQYNYNMDGKYLEDITITNPTNTKHPEYHAFYASDTTGLWTITVMQDRISAYAVQKTLELADEGKLDAPIHLAESKEILSYDSFGNKYYLTIPKKTEMDIRVVKKINKKTLDNYKFN